MRGTDMISNQIIQTSIDELKAITKVDIYVFDLDGIKVAATTEDIEISREIITGFAASPADSQVVGGRAATMMMHIWSARLQSARFRI